MKKKQQFLYVFDFIIVVDKTLIISNTRGILPDKIDDHIQFPQFVTLQLISQSDTMVNYDLQRMFRFILFRAILFELS